MSTRAVYQPLSEKHKHTWRSCISPARYSCISTAIKPQCESTSGRHSRNDQGSIPTAKAAYQQQSKVKAKALLDGTAVLTWVVSQPRTSKQEHLRRSCMSQGRYSCVSPAIETSSRSASGGHRRVARAGISTARAVYQQQSKTKAEAFLGDAAMSTWAVYQTQPTKQKHLWRSCISPAWVHQRGIAVHQQQYIKLKRKRKPFRTTRPGRPGRCVNDESWVSTAIKN